VDQRNGFNLKRLRKRLKRDLGNGLLDLRDTLLGARPPLTPPRRLDHNHGFAGGEEIVRLLGEYAGLGANTRILDIGCGVGRVAAPLTRVLGPDGRYVGIDIVPAAIDWLRQAYRPHRNFEFFHSDIHNSAYNPKGRMTADRFAFPFADGRRFDIVFLVSVFTHMYPKHIHHYLGEIAKVLDRDGVLFASFFVLDDYALGAQGDERGLNLKRKFTFKGDGFHAPPAGNPELAVAFDIEQLQALFADTGLGIDLPIRFGSWCGRPGAHGFYQDVVLARRGA